MEYNDEFLKTLRVNVNPDNMENSPDSADLVINENEEEYLANPKGFLSLIIESKIENQLNKIDILNEKISVLHDKIQRHYGKIDKLKTKIVKLEKQSQFLEAVARAYPKLSEILKTKIDKNREKISSIKNEKIPCRLDKIDKHNSSIKKLDKKIEKRNLKIKTYENIQNYFDSFSISNSEQRHDNFISCLKSMNNSAVFKTQNKLERNILKLEELKEKTQFLSKNTLRTDKSTRDWIEAKTEKFEGKISSLENKVKLQTQKLDKYMQLNTDMNNINSNLPMEHNHQIEDIMNKSEADLPSLSELAAENISSSLLADKMADRILTNNADIIRDTLSKTKDIRVEKSIESSSRINPAEKNQIKILEKNNTAEKKPSLLNKLKENEKTVKQKPEKQKQKSVDKEQLAI